MPCTYTNEVRLMGLLAAPPEFSCSDRGEALCSMLVLVRNGDRVERIPVDVCGEWVENLLITANTGSLVLIEGKLVVDESTKPNASVKVVAQRVLDIVAFAPGRELPSDLLPERSDD